MKEQGDRRKALRRGDFTGSQVSRETGGTDSTYGMGDAFIQRRGLLHFTDSPSAFSADVHPGVIVNPKQVIERTRRILTGFNSLSGIKIDFNPDNPPEEQFFIHAPKPQIAVTDEEAIAWGIADGMPAEYFKVEDREDNIDTARYLMRTEFIRPTGITSRDMKETRFAFPQIDDLLRQAQGKIVVLGSGFGELPNYIAEMHARGELAARPVIDDLFDYSVMEEDFRVLQRRFAKGRVAFPFSLQLSRIRGINNAIDSDNLEAVQYTVGSGSIPSQLMDAALVINIYGPSPHKTLYEQLSMLASGGSLLMVDPLLQHRNTEYGKIVDLVTSLPGFNIKPVVWLNNAHNTSIVTKLI